MQASEAQIKRHLDKLEACLVDGHWRLLDIQFKDKVLMHILEIREENGWSWSAVSLNVCCETLAGLYDRCM